MLAEGKGRWAVSQKPKLIRITPPLFRSEWLSSDDDDDDDDDDVVTMPVMVVIVVVVIVVVMIMLMMMMMMILNGSSGDVDQHHRCHLHNIGPGFKNTKG